MLLRCPMNHQWDVIPSDLFPATLYPLICPECGLDTTDPQGLATARLAFDSLESPRVLTPSANVPRHDLATNLHPRFRHDEGWATYPPHSV